MDAEHGGERTPDTVLVVRFFLVGAVTFALASLALDGLLRLGLWSRYLWFVTDLVAVTLAKLLGDLVYFAVSPRYRETVHLDDYLANDFLTYFRFGLPLAVALAFTQGRGYIPGGYGFRVATGAATLLFLVNRWLVERAQDKRRRQRGGVPVVRRPAS